MKRTALWSLAVLLCVSSAVAQDFLSKAKVALSTRDTASAIQNFTSAIKAGQKPAEAHYFLGSIAAARGHLADAQSQLEESVKLDEENADALSLLAHVYVAQGNNKAALAIYKKAQKAAPRNAAVATGYGTALLNADSVDAAIIQLTRAKDLNGENPAVYAALGEAYWKQNVPPLAVMNYQRAIGFDPTQYKYRYRLAEIFEKNRQYLDAVAQYDTVAVLDTTNADAYLKMGEILIRATGAQKRLAVAPLRRYVAKNPTSVQGATLLAKALFLVGDFKECAQAARVALTLDAKNPELWRELGHSLAETREFKDAIPAFEKLIEMKEFKPEDQAAYGNALAGVGREDDALKFLLDAIKTDSTNCDPYFPAGSIFMKKQDYVNATKMFEKKIECDPKSLSSYLNAAASYWQLKNWGRIRELLDKAIALKPDFLTARLWLARYYLQMDSLDKAKEEYDVVLQEGNAKPDQYKKEIGEAYSMTGSYYFTEQKYASAIESFRKALAVGYDNSGLHLSWGQAILQTLDVKESADETKAKKEDAVKHFRRSIELDSKNALAHLWLAQALILLRVEGQDEMNRKLQEEACSEFKWTLRLQPGNQDAKKGMDRYGCK
ncbi:MAG: tetratricopeptide repeat protein [Bacteroidota bacterium]